MHIPSKESRNVVQSEKSFRMTNMKLENFYNFVIIKEKENYKKWLHEYKRLIQKKEENMGSYSKTS